MADQFKLNGFSVDEDGKCTTDGGFAGDVSSEYVHVEGVFETVANVYMHNLPETDPNSPNQLWNDGGTLRISAG